MPRTSAGRQREIPLDDPLVGAHDEAVPRRARDGRWGPSLQGRKSRPRDSFASAEAGTERDHVDRGATARDDGAEDVTFAGWTLSSNFPTTPGAWDTTYNGGIIDVFVARLDPSRPSSEQLLHSTFVGGISTDQDSAFSVDASGVVTVAGWTNSSGFPTTPGAWDTTHNGNRDAFVARLDMLPAGASIYGASTPGCAGPLLIGVTSWPQVGNASFALTCGNAPPIATGLLAFSGAGLAAPFSVFGADIWVDLASPAFFTVFVTSNALGAALVPIPIPNVPTLAGGQAFAQFFWAGPSSPPPCPALGISASGALAIVVQP